MNISSILGLLAQALLAYETGLAEIEAGSPVTSPQVQVGSVNGKPLYASVTLSTTKA